MVGEAGEESRTEETILRKTLSSFPTECTSHEAATNGDAS